jgi:hypothetical protein
MSLSVGIRLPVGLGRAAPTVARVAGPRYQAPSSTFRPVSGAARFMLLGVVEGNALPLPTRPRAAAIVALFSTF